VTAFQLVSQHRPSGDQPNAIRELGEGLVRGDRHQVLLGATGTGKTFSIAHVIAEHGRPALLMSHNKTLAAQLYGELKALFPHNAVEYFISYYDYYQPEAYVPSTDTFIEKDASINEDIERLRLRATSSLMEREDVIVVASVSCIYGLGNPDDYRSLMLHLQVGEERPRKEILRGLVDIQYKRNDYLFERATFRVRGDTIEVFPAYEEQAIRIELWGDEVERITRFDPLTGEIITELERTAIYPASHYVTKRRTIEEMVPLIRDELEGTRDVGVVDRRGETLPLDAELRTAEGRTVRLGDYFDGDRPVLVVPAYFECPLLCTMVLERVQDGLNGMDWTAGEEFRVVTFSFDHRDTPARARAKRDLYPFGYRELVDDPGEAWAFLTTDAATAREVCSALGYHYKFLPDVGEYSHVAAVFFVRPDGTVHNFIEGLEYPPRSLTLGLSEASENTVGTVFERIVFSCYRYDPKTGEWKVHPMSVMRIGAGGVAVGLAIVIGALFISGRRGAPGVGAEAGVGPEDK